MFGTICLRTGAGWQTAPFTLAGTKGESLKRRGDVLEVALRKDCHQSGRCVLVAGLSVAGDPGGGRARRVTWLPSPRPAGPAVHAAGSLRAHGRGLSDPDAVGEPQHSHARKCHVARGPTGPIGQPPWERWWQEPWGATEVQPEARLGHRDAPPGATRHDAVEEEAWTPPRTLVPVHSASRTLSRCHCGEAPGAWGVTTNGQESPDQCSWLGRHRPYPGVISQWIRADCLEPQATWPVSLGACRRPALSLGSQTAGESLG